MNLLVIAAHPDDEVLGCGGTIARRSAEGANVEIAILGEGITARCENPGQANQRDLRNLHRSSKKVAALLGARHVSSFGLPDNRFDTVPLLEIVKEIESLMEAVQPECVFVQHGGDLNIDHQVTFKATLAATRPMAGRPVHTVCSYEVNSSTEWAFNSFSPMFQPSVFVDITTTLERKIEAMKLYDTELRPFPHPRSAEALRSRAQCWGSTVGVRAAEAFHVVWMRL